MQIKQTDTTITDQVTHTHSEAIEAYFHIKISLFVQINKQYYCVDAALLLVMQLSTAISGGAIIG